MNGQTKIKLGGQEMGKDEWANKDKTWWKGKDSLPNR